MISKDSKKRLFEVMQRVAGLKSNLNENYPMGAESDPTAPWNQKDEEPDVEEFDTYDRYRDDSMDETPNDGTREEIGEGVNPNINKILKELSKYLDSATINYIDSLSRFTGADTVLICDPITKIVDTFNSTREIENTVLLLLSKLCKEHFKKA